MMRRWLFGALALIVAGSVLAISPAFFRGGFRYLLLDRFLTDASAPLSSPRTCEPGPGQITFTDTANRFSITGGALTLGSSTTAATAAVSVAARPAGYAIMATLSSPTGTSRWGYLNGPMFTFTVGAMSVRDVSSAVYATGLTTPTNVAIISRSTGAFYVADGTLWWVDHATTGAGTWYVLQGTAAAGTLTVDNARAVVLPSWSSDALVYTSYVASPANPTTSTSRGNAIVSVTWTPGAGETLNLWVRRTAATDGWVHRCDQAGSTIKNIEVVAGDETERASPAQTWTVATPYRVISISDGAVIRQFADKTLLNTYSSATTNQTATGVYLSGHTTAADLYAWPRTVALPGGV